MSTNNTAAERVSNKEKLRLVLLNEIYAGGFSCCPAMLIEENEIKKASDYELLEIARRYGII